MNESNVNGKFYINGKYTFISRFAKLKTPTSCLEFRDHVVEGAEFREEQLGCSLHTVTFRH